MRAIIIDKVKNSTSKNKSYITFDYFRVIEFLLDFYLELSLRVYNYLSNPRYKYLFSTNLKYTYLIISLYLDDRYYFAFIILEID